MQTVITRTTPIYRSQSDHGIFLQWVVESPTVNPIVNTKIERAGSPEGPYELVIDGVVGFHFYDDLRNLPAPASGNTRENLNFLSLSRQVYYRITVTDSAGVSSAGIRSLGAGLPRRQMLLKRKILRDERIGFKFNGTQFAVLKRRHWGTRCKVCFDLLTKRVTRSKCNECYGTGFEGGYWAPVRITARQGVTNVQTQIAPQGNVDINKKRLVLLDYPAVEPFDVLVDIAQNARFIVDTATRTELRSVVVHQELTISEIARDSIEYRIPVNFDHMPVIY
jgi:hypothetical protein